MELCLYSIGLVITILIVEAKPPSLQKCSEPTGECLKTSIQRVIPDFIRGIPELGLEPLEPFHIDRLDINLPGFRISFLQGLSQGLSKCKVVSAKLIGDDLSIQFNCNLKISSKYKSHGQFIMFQVNGDGDTTIKCRNLNITCSLKLVSKIGADGQKYFDVTNFKSHHSYDGRVSYKMTNIFQNNPMMNKVVVDFMNSNWRMVAEEFGNPLIQHGVDIVLKNVKQLFKTVPMNQLVEGRYLSSQLP